MLARLELEGSLIHPTHVGMNRTMSRGKNRRRNIHPTHVGMPIKDWGQILMQLMVFFGDRVNVAL